jgi:hypothetical protein
MKILNQEVQFKCTKGPKNYWTKYALQAHMNVSHDNVKQYQCYFCSFAYFEKSLLIHHISKHTKEKPHKCQYCCQWFRGKDSVRRHKNGNSCNQKLTHQLLRPCYFCGKSLSNHQVLKEHMKTAHLKEDFKRCNLCHKYFSSSTDRNRHIRTVHLSKERISVSYVRKIWAAMQICIGTFGACIRTRNLLSVISVQNHL